jgi:hypothetical protein
MIVFMAGPRHPGPAPKKDRSAQLQVLETKARVLDLWREGHTYGTISYLTGYSIWSVGEIVRGALAELRANTLEEHRDRHYARLEELFRALYPATFVDCPAREDVAAVLGILDRESRLLGLDAPKKTTVRLPASDDEMKAFVGALVAWVRREGASEAEASPPPALATDIQDSEESQHWVRDVESLSSVSVGSSVVNLGEANEDSCPPPALSSRKTMDDRVARERQRELERRMEETFAV